MNWKNIITEKFILGAKVKILSDFDSLYKGDTGIIRFINGDEIGVEWDRNMNGHDLDGLAKHGYGWYVQKEDIEVIE